MRNIAAAVLFLFIALMPLTAPAATDDDVRAVIGMLFDAMREGDAEKLHNVFHPQARLLTVVTHDGETKLHEGSVDAFAQAVSAPHDAVWDERIWNVRIQIDNGLAVAWMNYGFWLGETFSHCGVDAFELLHTASGWKIFQLTDTRQHEGCELPDDS